MEAPKAAIKRAKSLRSEMSLPEVLLWRLVRGRKLHGWRFRRQHPIGSFVLDFYCDELKLAAEIDGAHHGFGDRPLRDARRDAWLAGQGVDVLRIPARDVLEDMDGVIQLLAREGGGRAPSVSPLRVDPPPPEGEDC